MDPTYRKLCEATADELFNSSKAGFPAYTLPEDEALVRITESIGLEAQNARDEYCRVVRRTLYLDTPGTAPLRWHTETTSRFLRSKTPLETPPSLPLLVVFTLAAEAMQGDSNMAANNFYGRVRPLLQVPPEREHLLISGYQKSADLLWRSLNVWLEAWEGERGVPTAYSLGHMRHIGLPMSQAVVRQHDRIGLIEVFGSEALPPGFRMSPEDMELVLDTYAINQPSPLSTNIRRLWSNQDARARIVQAACLELESWTGAAGRESTQRASRSARLIAYLRTFLRTSIEFNIEIPLGQHLGNGELVFQSDKGQVSLPIIQSSPGSARLASVEAVNSASIVGEALSGWVFGDEKASFGRRPRRVVPLRWDELQGCYIEVERVSLGEDHLILARVDLQEQVRKVLVDCARPGWNLIEEAPGLPNDWIVFTRVQVVLGSDAVVHVDLTALVPRSRTTLTTRGGFDLPGRLRKWSSLQPPEVMAYAVGADSVTIQISKGDHLSDEAERLSVESQGEFAILTLSNYELEDGEYFASMFVDGEKKPRSGSIVRLRSADTPLFRVEEADMHLVYSPESCPTWPLTAGAPLWSDYVNGARIVGEGPGVGSRNPMPEFMPRKRIAAKEVSRSAIRVGEAYSPESCMVTGRHRFQLPKDTGERPKSPTLQGECTTCGLVRRFAATPWAATKRKSQEKQAVHRAIELPPISRSTGPDLRVVFDAICHVGQGSYRDLERITAHIEGGDFQADNFLRACEVVGHIDVSRDELLQVSNWAVNAPTITPTGAKEWTLIGFCSRSMLEAIRSLLGTEAVAEHQEHGELRTVLRVDSDSIDSKRGELEALGIQVRETSPALEVATRMPPLSQIENGLHRISLPGYRSLARWEVESAAWVPTDSLASPGAYRLRDFRSLYVVRSQQDLERGTAGVGTAQLVKHIASGWASSRLVGYHTKTASVLTPLGADLPGLYGRALALCSGRAPVKHEKSRLVQYTMVEREVADVIFDRLTK